MLRAIRLIGKKVITLIYHIIKYSWQRVTCMTYNCGFPGSNISIKGERDRCDFNRIDIYSNCHSVQSCQKRSDQDLFHKYIHVYIMMLSFLSYTFLSCTKLGKSLGTTPFSQFVSLMQIILFPVLRQLHINIIF